jgi:hypothetical protein
MFGRACVWIPLVVACGATHSHVPVASIQGDAVFRERLQALAAFGSERIGHRATGPFSETADVAAARALVQVATPDQLRQLLACDNAQIRANVGAQIASHRPDDPRLASVLRDDTELSTPGLDDVGANPDVHITVGDFVRDAAEIARIDARTRAAYVAPEERCTTAAECVVTDFPGCCECCDCAQPYAIRRDHLQRQRERCSAMDCAPRQEELGCAAEECVPCSSPDERTAVCHAGRCELR